MNPLKGYYSLVQYCPDPARQEAVNLGVVFLCPQTRFLNAKLVPKNVRALKFFGAKADASLHLEAMKQALWNRLSVERESMITLEGFQRFVDTRANHLLLTAPKVIRTLDAAKELEILFDELVQPAQELSESTVRRVEPIHRQLEFVLSSPDLQPYLKRNVKVLVPALGRAVEVPFGYQNGRFNLVQPVNFGQKSADKVGDAACRYAVEGDSLFKHRDEQFGEMQLCVVAQFRSDADQGRETVARMFEEYHVRLISAEDAGGLEREILDHGKLLG